MSEQTEEQKQEEALKQINEKTTAAYKLIREAEEIADKAKITFNFSVAYGMGGTYVPEGLPEDDWYSSDTGWVSSSADC